MYNVPVKLTQIIFVDRLKFGEVYAVPPGQLSPDRIRQSMSMLKDPLAEHVSISELKSIQARNACA